MRFNNRSLKRMRAGNFDEPPVHERMKVYVKLLTYKGEMDNITSVFHSIISRGASLEAL